MAQQVPFRIKDQLESESLKEAQPRRIVWNAGWLGITVIILWFFPSIWYTKIDKQQERFWLSEQTNISGWSFRDVAVAKVAESVLAADRLVSGEFTASDGRVVRVFSAKRYVESLNEMGLFIHTPDRCWTQAGWTIDPVQPEYKQLVVHGIPFLFERRVFRSGTQQELVYFAGLVGGQPLPYRLDHNLSLAVRRALHNSKQQNPTDARHSETRALGRVWDSFWARRPLLGPKQFIRISTTISEGGLEPADMLLEEFLSKWLSVGDYNNEIQAWLTRPSR